VKAQKIDTIIDKFDSPIILSIDYDLESLRIRYSANENDEYIILFNNPIGFKCLDERDMMDYWKHKVLTDNWIIEILEGGWLDMERSNSFISDKILNVREFLIEGNDECLTVLSEKKPVIERT
jgi:hypothetical protein